MSELTFDELVRSSQLLREAGGVYYIAVHSFADFKALMETALPVVFDGRNPPSGAPYASFHGLPIMVSPLIQPGHFEMREARA